jgi:hypothetical protein
VAFLLFADPPAQMGRLLEALRESNVVRVEAVIRRVLAGRLAVELIEVVLLIDPEIELESLVAGGLVNQKLERVDRLDEVEMVFEAEREFATVTHRVQSTELAGDGLRGEFTPDGCDLDILTGLGFCGGFNRVTPSLCIDTRLLRL